MRTEKMLQKLQKNTAKTLKKFFKKRRNPVKSAFTGFRY